MTLYGLNENQRNWFRRMMGTRDGGSMPSQFRDRPVSFIFKNESGEIVPPYACMKVTDITDLGDGRYGFLIEKPTDSAGLFVFNGPNEVAVGEPDNTGTGLVGPAVVAATTGTIANGDRLSPSGWELAVSSDGQAVATAYGPIDGEKCLALVPAGPTDCDTLQPGVYKGTAGGPIAAGDTGTVLVNGEEVTALNQSECPVELTDRVVVAVSDNCDVFFTPCVCCSESTDCCDISVAICICGDRQVLAVDGGNYTWDVLECCDGCEEEAATLEITLSCSDPTITASWDYTCGATTDSGTVDLSSLCDDTNEVLIEDGISITGCSLNDSYANYLMECNTETAECCIDWNASGASDGASEANANTNTVSGSSGGMTTVVSVSKFDTLFCQGQTITITMTVTGHDGSADPFIQWDKNLNSCGGTSAFSVQSHSPAGTVGATSVTWPGGGNGTYIVTLKWDSGCFSVGGGCTVGTAVFEVEGVGGRDSGALHQYITTSTVT